MGEFALGQAVPRFEDPRLLRGGGRYVDDMVLPRMAFGHVLRSPHAHARIRAIDTAAAKAAPGVLAVLTGADWAGVGLGRSAGAGRARSGATARRSTGRAFRRWSRTGCAGSAIMSPLSSPRPGTRRADAAELIEVDYEPLPAIVSTAGRGRSRARRWCGTIARTTSASSISRATRRRPRPPSPRADACRQAPARHQPGHRARRWSRAAAIGDYNAAEDRYTIYTTLQRTHAYRAELVADHASVPESKMRVVAGDIGGSFGMKSAIYNEVALVLLASKLRRPAGQMDQHPLGGVPVRRAGARQCHRGRAGARQGRAFSRLPGHARSPRSAPIRRPAPTPSSSISAPWPGSTARRRCMPR